MRDGEKFFAEGRDNVDFALVQQQMKRAGAWRVNLRRDVLRSLAGLGRDVRRVQREYEGREKLSKMAEGMGGYELLQESFENRGRVDGNRSVFTVGGVPGAFGDADGLSVDFAGRGGMVGRPVLALDDTTSILPTSSTAASPSQPEGEVDE